MLAPTLTDQSVPAVSPTWPKYLLQAEIARLNKLSDDLITTKQRAQNEAAQAIYVAEQMREKARKFRQQRNWLLFVIFGLIFLGPYALEVAAK